MNLERAVRVDQRLGGHIVQGHVDGTGVILQPRARRALGGRDRLPAADLARYVVHKGSITVDGVSLTVASVSGERVHRQPDPHHAGPDHPRPEGRRRPGEPGGRRHREVRREAGGPMNAGFEVLGTTVLWTDLIGNILALATVVFAIRRSLWTWPVQLTASVLLLAASINAGLTGNALKQVLFGVLADLRLGALEEPGRRARRAARHLLAERLVLGRHGGRRHRSSSGGSSSSPGCRGALTPRCPRGTSWWRPTPTSSSAARSRPGPRAGR